VGGIILIVYAKAFPSFADIVPGPSFGIIGFLSFSVVPDFPAVLTTGSDIAEAVIVGFLGISGCLTP